jgi:3-dehydroquinate dehydratase
MRKKYINKTFRTTKTATQTALKNLRKREPFRKHTAVKSFRTKRNGQKVLSGYHIYSYKKR